MAHYRGIFGFEGGDMSGVFSSGGGVVLSAAARPGGSAYGLRVSTPTAITQVKTLVPTSGQTNGANYDVKIRVCFKVNAYPSSSGFQVFKVGSNNPILQMDTTGHIRLMCSGNVTMGYSTDPCVLGEWYQADCYIHGWNGDGVSFGRRKESIAVYDSTGASFFTSQNPDQQDTTHWTPIPIIGDYDGTQGPCTVGRVEFGRLVVNSFYAGFSGNWDVLYGKGCPSVTGYNFVETPFNTTFLLSPSQASDSVRLPLCHVSASFLGKAYENGLMSPWDDACLGYQWQSAAQLVMSDLYLGDAGAATRSIDYDDLWFDVTTGDDVTGSTAFPSGTHISRVLVTAQGASDQFSTSGNFAAVAEAPLASGTITGNYGDVTTYDHEQLDGSITKVEHVRMYMNASVNAATGDGYLILGGVQYAIEYGNTIAAGAGTIIADRIGDYNRSSFNVAEFGAENNEPTKVVTIGNLYMEVLNGITSVIAPFQFDVCTDWESQPIEPGEDTTSPVDDLFPECNGT